MDGRSQHTESNSTQKKSHKQTKQCQTLAHSIASQKLYCYISAKAHFHRHPGMYLSTRCTVLSNAPRNASALNAINANPNTCAMRISVDPVKQTKHQATRSPNCHMRAQLSSLPLLQSVSFVPYDLACLPCHFAHDASH